jgi:hypothetical protein
MIMKYKDFTGIIPQQYTGEEIEAESSKEFSNVKEARVFYTAARERLFNVNQWHQIAGRISAHFQIVDHKGQEVQKNAAKGDYIRIDIPGPVSKEGKGYDWACVEEEKEFDEGEVQSIAFRVRPSKNPTGEKDNIAHFYSDESTSNFIVTREGTKVQAIIIDRNIKPNTETESIIDKVRDSTVGIGAITMFSKAQWQSLVDAIIYPDQR